MKTTIYAPHDMTIHAQEVVALQRRRRMHGLFTGTVLWAFVIAGMIFMLLPGVWMILSSFKTVLEITAVPLRLLPERFLWQNYAKAMEYTQFPRALLNSLIVTSAITVANVLTGTWGGYTFGKLRWPGRDTVFMVLLSTLMVPAFLTVIPRYLLVNWMGMINTYSGMVVPFLMGTFGIFLTKQYMLSIPDELVDAARVDGCSALGIYWYIILPMCRPIIAVLTITTLNQFWDALLWGLMILTKHDMFTIPVALSYLKDETDWMVELQMAGGTLAVVPVLIVFIIFQKQIIQGVALSGLKG